MAKTRLQELATYKLKGTINERVGRFQPYDSNEELANYLQHEVGEYIRKKYDGTTYKGWTLDYDKQAGTFMWVSKKSDLHIYCTPGWEGFPGIPVSVSTSMGDELSIDELGGETLSIKLGIDPSTEILGDDPSGDGEDVVWEMMKSNVDHIIRQGLDKKYPYTGD